MSYLVIDDFKLGMDRRKDRISGVPGALWEGINGHVTRGGDFERRKKLVAKYTLPAGTFGLTQINKQLYVFGSGNDPGVPAGVNYQKLAHTASANMSAILDVTTFSSKIYAVAQFDNGDIYHYYDGTRVSAWDALANANSGNSAIASALAAKISLDPRYIASAVGAKVTIIAAIAGTAFTITGTAVQGGATNDQTLTVATPQANVAAVPETRATFTITVVGGTPSNDPNDANQNSIRTLHDNSGQTLIAAPLPWVVSNNFTAQSLANQINNKGVADTQSGTPGYSATFSGSVVTVSAPIGKGATYNGLHIFSRTTGNFSWNSPTVSGISNTGLSEVDCGSLSSGVNAVAAVAQVSTATVGGTYEGGDIFTLTVDSVAYKTTGLAAGMGITALTYSTKVYSVSGSLVEFSKVNDPTDWSGTGSGLINITNQNADSEALVGIQQYQTKIAIFSRSNIQIWTLAVDPSQNTFTQTVQNTGALSNRSIIQYGNIDVFYLNDQGVRSLRARDSSNAPAVNDVGVAIDSFVQDYIATLSGQQISRACAVIEPLSGRYWLALHNRIFVYSFYPGSKISAWSYYDLSGEIGANDITEMVRAGNRIYIRAANTIYLFGGDTNAVYPSDNEIPATISLPYLSSGKPATIKGVKSFDAGLRNTWDCYLLPIASDDTEELHIGIFNGPTYAPNKHNPIQHPIALFALRMVCNTAGYASVSNIAVHFDVEDET